MSAPGITAFDAFVWTAFLGAKTPAEVRQQRDAFRRDYGLPPSEIFQLDAAQREVALTRHVVTQKDAPRLASGIVQLLAELSALYRKTAALAAVGSAASTLETRYLHRLALLAEFVDILRKRTEFRENCGRDASWALGHLRNPALQHELKQWAIRRPYQEVPAGVQALLKDLERRLVRRSSKERATCMQALLKELPARAAELNEINAAIERACGTVNALLRADKLKHWRRCRNQTVPTIPGDNRDWLFGYVVALNGDKAADTASELWHRARDTLELEGHRRRVSLDVYDDSLDPQIWLDLDQLRELVPAATEVRPVPAPSEAAPKVLPPGAPTIEEMRTHKGSTEQLVMRWADAQYLKEPPGRNEMLDDFRELYGNIRGVNVKTIAAVLRMPPLQNKLSPKRRRQQQQRP